MWQEGSPAWKSAKTNTQSYLLWRTPVNKLAGKRSFPTTFSCCLFLCLWQDVLYLIPAKHALLGKDPIADLAVEEFCSLLWVIVNSADQFWSAPYTSQFMLPLLPSVALSPNTSRPSCGSHSCQGQITLMSCFLLIRFSSVLFVLFIYFFYQRTFLDVGSFRCF